MLQHQVWGIIFHAVYTYYKNNLSTHKELLRFTTRSYKMYIVLDVINTLIYRDISAGKYTFLPKIHRRDGQRSPKFRNSVSILFSLSA